VDITMRFGAKYARSSDVEESISTCRLSGAETNLRSIDGNMHATARTRSSAMRTRDITPLWESLLLGVKTTDVRVQTNQITGDLRPVRSIRCCLNSCLVDPVMTEKVPAENADLPYNVFLERYLRPLKPCIISGLAEKWPAFTECTQFDGDLRVPRFTALRELFGTYSGCITLCNRKDENNEAIQSEISVSDFIDILDSKRCVENISLADKPYLKDFHFMRVNVSLSQPCTVPIFFQGMPFVIR
jgi:hypothetical protein